MAFQERALPECVGRTDYVISEVALVINDKAWDDRTSLDFQLLRAERARKARWQVDGGVTKTPGERAFLEATDQLLLNLLEEEGFLTTAPQVIQDDGNYNLPGCAAIQEGGSARRILMVSDERGNHPHVVTEPGKKSALDRCRVLLHEAAHCEFDRFRAPFQPEDNDLPIEAIDAFNHWVFKPFFAHREDHRSVLEESFCDCYGGMMLLKVTNFDLEAFAILQSLIEKRQSRREEVEAKVNPDRCRKAWRLLSPMPTHSTDFALRRMMEDVDNWKDLTPQQMQDKAKAYASDGFMDVINPERLNSRGARVGEYFRDGVINPSLGREDMMSLLSFNAYLFTVIGLAGMEGNEIPTRQWLDTHLHSHPMQETTLRTLAELLPQCRDFYQAAGPNFVEALRRNQPEAVCATSKLQQDVLIPYRERADVMETWATLDTLEKQACRVLAQALSPVALRASLSATDIAFPMQGQCHEHTMEHSSGLGVRRRMAPAGRSR